MNIELPSHRHAEAQLKAIQAQLDRDERAMIRILAPLLLLVSVLAIGLVSYVIVAA